MTGQPEPGGSPADLFVRMTTPENRAAALSVSWPVPDAVRTMTAPRTMTLKVTVGGVAGSERLVVSIRDVLHRREGDLGIGSASIALTRDQAAVIAARLLAWAGAP